MNAPANIAFNPATFDWWKSALKGIRGPISEGEPMQGYYRSRVKNRQTGEETLRAVAYWYRGDRLCCQVDTKPMEGEQLQRWVGYWPYVSKEPVTYEAWSAVVKEGKPWPDQHVIEKAAPAEASTQPLDANGHPPAAGAAEPLHGAEPAMTHTDASNGKPVGQLTPQGQLKMEIDAAIKSMSRYVKPGEKGEPVNLITSDDMAGAAQSLRDALNKLANKAKKAREEANRPHNDAIRANGLIWSPLETMAKDAGIALRDGPMKAWEVHKRDQQARANIAAQAASAASGQTVAPRSNAPAPSAQIKGATGKAASVSTVKVAEIEDIDKVFQHFKNDAQVRAILQGLATAAIRAGISVPGAIEKEDVAIK